MPKQPTKKSQTGRKPKCRRCYVDMVEQGHIEGGWNWMCLKCGLVHKQEPSYDCSCGNAAAAPSVSCKVHGAWA